MDPISKPISRPQPDLVQYGIGELALFKTFTRESFVSVFGVQPPAFDPARRMKAWFDTSVDLADPDSLVVYRVVAQDRSGATVLRQVGMPAHEAATVNLPGVIAYAPYIVAGTQATRGGSPLNPDYLSLRQDAEELASTLGAEGIVDEGATSVYPAEYPADEARRMWAVTLRGRSFNTGILLKSRNGAGVGAPGQWSTAGGDPVWVPSPAPSSQVPAAVQTPWEMPCRDLLSNEAFQPGIFGPAVVRTDKHVDADLVSGRFLPSDRQMLQSILQLLQARS